MKPRPSPGNRYVYDKWTKYVPRTDPSVGLAGGKVVHLDRVIWENIADEQTATAALQSGEIDFYELPPIDLLPQLQADPNIKIAVLNKTGNVGIARLNCLHKPFDNRSMRGRPCCTCSTRPTSSRRVSATRNTTRPAHPSSAATTPMQTDANTDWFKQGVDLAEREGVVPEGRIQRRAGGGAQATNFAFMNNSAQLIAGQLQKIGVNAQLAASDWGGVMTRRASMEPDDKGGWDIFITYGSGYANGNPISLNALAMNGKKGGTAGRPTRSTKSCGCNGRWRRTKLRARRSPVKMAGSAGTSCRR